MVRIAADNTGEMTNESTRETLLSLEARLVTSRDIALERMKTLCVPANSRNEYEWGLTGKGLASMIVSVLRNAADSWFRSIGKREQEVSCHTQQYNTDGMKLTVSDPSSEEKKENESSVVGHTFRQMGQACDLERQSICVNGEKSLLVAGSNETETLRRALRLHLTLSRLDPTLGEELGRAGSHIILSTIMNFDLHSAIPHPLRLSEEDEDAVMEVQELACEIGSLSKGSFPLRYSPFSDDELRARLPLSFVIEPLCSTKDGELETANLIEEPVRSKTILINQVTTRQTSQDDVGFVVWPSAVVLSRWLVTNKEFIMGKTVLELGAGCGLVGLVVARLVKEQQQMSEAVLSSSVILTDFNDKVIDNLDKNIRLNEVTSVACTAKLDFYLQEGKNYHGSWVEGSTGQALSAVDIIVGADIICRPEDAVAVANTIYDALKPGGMAIIVCADAKHRFGSDIFASECERVGLVVTTSNVADLYNGEFVHDAEEMSGLEQTCGYVEGMTLILFQIVKSRQ